MRRCSPLLVLALGVAATLPNFAAGATGAPTQRPTTADTRLATSALLTRSDLGGTGWKSLPGAKQNSSSCGIILHLGPNQSGLTQTGAASGPVYTNGAYGALSQSATVFATPGQATTAWARTINKNLVICMEQQAEATSTMGVPVSVTTWSHLHLTGIPGRIAAYRVEATVTAGKKKANVFFDQIVLEHQRTLTRINFSSLRAPFPLAYETQLARLISGRLSPKH